jgi:hypothetical protein
MLLLLLLLLLHKNSKTQLVVVATYVGADAVEQGTLMQSR